MLIEGKPRSVVLQQSLYQNLQRYKNPPNSFKESEEFSAIQNGSFLASLLLD